MGKRIFVTGIGTEVGKTVCSAIIVKALGADYWKPVQAGDLERSDSISIKELVPDAYIHPEAYRLSQPMSPHAAAEIDDVVIKREDFTPPETSNDLVIEGAGGLCVPLSESTLVIDLIADLNCPVVLVSHNYLGSINHTLLSIEALRSRRIEIFGILFNGEENEATQAVIEEYSGVRVLGRIEQTETVSAEWVAHMADQFAAVFGS